MIEKRKHNNPRFRGRFLNQGLNDSIKRNTHAIS